MGHAHHFLSRLERVSMDHVELALSLYNHPETLKYVLSHARLPDGAERVAISLDDPTEGPFLLVTREGRFVTCLGRGMHHDLPTIERSRFDALCDRAAEFGERRRLAAQLAPDERASARLVARIQHAGPHLTREEFQALSTLQPLLWSTLLGDLVQASRTLTDQRIALCGAGHVAPVTTDFWDYWKTLWSMKHLFLLLGVDQPMRFLARLPAAALANMRHSLSEFGALQASFPVMVAASWFTSRFDGAFLPVCRHHYKATGGHRELVSNAMDLLAMGGRDADRREAVLEALCPDRGTAANDGPSRALHAMRASIHARYADDLQRPGVWSVRAAERGASVLVERLKPLAAVGKAWSSTLDVPVTVARAVLVNQTWDSFNVDANCDQMLALMPSIAQMHAEEFYLPAAWQRELGTPWNPYDARDSVNAYAAYLRKNLPPKEPRVTAGRNERCPCGSGAKAKKCCASPRRAPPVAPSLAEILRAA